MSHFPRVPLDRQYPDLYKGSMAGTGLTDHKTNQPVPTETYTPEYRAPADRVSGNVIFRRQLNGQIDLEAAVDVVTSAINQLKFKGPLNDMETRVLCACFPEAMRAILPDVDGRMSMHEAKSRLKVSEEEIRAISAGVAVRLMELHEWLRYGPKL